MLDFFFLVKDAISGLIGEDLYNLFYYFSEDYLSATENVFIADFFTTLVVLVAVVFIFVFTIKLFLFIMGKVCDLFGN